MTREDLKNQIIAEFDRRGGAFSMTKHDVAVFCYNLGVERAMEAVYDNQKCYTTEDLKIKDLTKQNGL